MTSAERAPCTREVRVQDGNRWVLYSARITGEGVYLRQKHKRTEYGPVTWGTILLRGVQAAALAAVEDRPKRAKRVRRGLL